MHNYDSNSFQFDSIQLNENHKNKLPTRLSKNKTLIMIVGENIVCKCIPSPNALK